VGIVFQDPENQLFSMTVTDELAFGPVNMGKSPETSREIVQDALRRFKIEKYAYFPPAILGFGMRRKVSLAAMVKI
jgi:energy-coupling factor transporter ATP-binding protein EcfA2